MPLLGQIPITLQTTEVAMLAFSESERESQTESSKWCGARGLLESPFVDQLATPSMSTAKGSMARWERRGEAGQTKKGENTSTKTTHTHSIH